LPLLLLLLHFYLLLPHRACSFKLRSEALVLGAHKVPVAGIARTELPPLSEWLPRGVAGM
jgi:hypothetical protein